MAIPAHNAVVLPSAYRSLATAVGWSLTTAVIAQVSMPAAAGWASFGFLLAVLTKHPLRRSGLCALPILLAQMPTNTAPPPTVRPGPVWVEGLVGGVLRAPLTGRNHVQFSKDLWVAFSGEIELLPGDWVRVLARGGAPTIPGQQPTLSAIKGTMRVEKGPWSLSRICAGLRRSLERQLCELVPGEHGVMLATLVLGRATRPDPALAEAHRATGLSHLLAVSGAHAAMLAFLLGLSSRGRHLGAGRARSFLVLAILIIYGGIAGSEPPVMRAVVAFTLATVAARLGRPCSIATCLLVPAWITCLIEPEALLGPSFLLSYAAVIGLSLALQDHQPGSLLGWLLNGLRASFWATLLTAPLTLTFFQQLAPWTIVLTPLCAPLVAMMLLLGLVAPTVVLLAPGLANVFAWPLHTMASIYAWLVHTADGLPGTPIPALFCPPAWAIVITVGTAIAFVLARPSKRRLIFAVLAFTSLWFLPLHPREDARLTLLAIGHGQAALVRTSHGHQIIIDCGSLQGGRRAARRLDETLTRRTVDLLVVTHEDQDHHNGVPFLLPRIRVLRAILPMEMAQSTLHQLLCANSISVTLLLPGERSKPLPDLEVLAPEVPMKASDNDRSLWVQTKIHLTTVLMSGDAQELGIAAALKSNFVSQCDVLVLPHHGRRNINAPHLLARTRPRACLASATSSDGETRLGQLVRKFGADLWTTGMHGSITLHSHPAHITSEHPRTLPKAIDHE